MFTSSDIENAYSIFKQIQPKIAESMIFYKNSVEPNYGHVVKYTKDNQIKALWLDFKDLNQWTLKILFMKHKQVNQAFFINEVNGFYRVGWKLKK